MSTRRPKKVPSTAQTVATPRRGLHSLIVQATVDRDRFDALLGQQHYLGRTRPVGDFLRQVIVRDGVWVALLAWGSPCYALKDRDRWIGWTRTQRVERLKLVVQNRRFLLLVERGAEPNLASAALAAATRALPAHWQETFGYTPVLAETFTDPELYAGTCYKAAGWAAVGHSQGYSRHRADFYVENDRPKRLWLKPLLTEARTVLCAGTLPAAQQAGQTAAPTGTLPLSSQQLWSFFEALQTVPDPRATRHFRIGSVLAIVAMALLCGQRDISQIHRFGWRLTQSQRGVLGLPMKKGCKRFREVPGYKVYYEVLRRVDLDELARVLNGWLQTHTGQLPGALAVDGKMVRDLVGTLNLVEHDSGVPVAVAIINQKDGETGCSEMKTAQRQLQTVPVLDGRVVTGDALHTQSQTARAIVERGGDYLLQIKGNQPGLLRQAQTDRGRLPPFACDQKGHGRLEHRVLTLAAIEPLRANFPFARTIVAVRKQTQRRGQLTEETRFFISSLERAERTPVAWLALIQGHWAGVEIRNHWRRDACWREDQTRSRNPRLVGALALLRSALLAVVADELEVRGSLPAVTECCAANPQLALRLIRSKL